MFLAVECLLGVQADLVNWEMVVRMIVPHYLTSLNTYSAHTAVLTNKGMTFMFGDSRYDQLGW